MGGKKAMQDCYIVLVGKHEDSRWTKESISKWVGKAGGQLLSKPTKEITHLVVHEREWRARVDAVQKALDLEREGCKFKFVSWDWLSDSLSNSTRKPTKTYECKTIWPVARQSTKKKTMEKATEKAEEPKKTTKGDYKDFFLDSTDNNLTEQERREVKAQNLAQQKFEDALRTAKERDKREQKKRQDERMMQSAVFKQGAKKARNELFSENYHIYVDHTGFKYDVLLTKVDTKHNRNERYALTLQIYEHNVEPRNYAMNAQFAGTDHHEANNIVAAIGSSYEVAFHAFKSEFKVYTGVEWNQRISHHIEREKRGKRERGLSTGSETGTQKGKPVSSQSSGRKAAGGATKEEDFSTVPFQYHPPAYGPKGALPENEEIKLREIAKGYDRVPSKADEDDKGQDIEMWMSGANGPGPVDLSSPSIVPQSFPPQEARNPLQRPAERDGDAGEQTSDLDAFLASHDFGSITQLNEGTGMDDMFNNNQEQLFVTDYPFGGDFNFPSKDEFDQAAGATQHPSFDHTVNATQDPSFNKLTEVVQESFEPGSQDSSETQLAARAAAEFEEYVDRPADTADTQHENEKMKGVETEEVDTTTENANASASPIPSFDLGSSFLGKRKREAEVEESQVVDTPVASEPAEEHTVPENGGEIHIFTQDKPQDQNFDDAEAREDIPQTLADKQNAVADEQLQQENEMAAGEATEV